MGTSAAHPNSKTLPLAAVAELGDEAMALARPDLHPREFVALLLDKALFPDAVRFVAHALPKREAVWWAWVSARRAAGSAAGSARRIPHRQSRLWRGHPRGGQQGAQKGSREVPRLRRPRPRSHPAHQALGFQASLGESYGNARRQSDRPARLPH